MAPVEVTSHNVPTAESPQQLRKPGGTDELVTTLESKGYLSAAQGKPSSTQLSEAVKKFQESQGLAATGYADSETLKRLGCDAHPSLA